MDLITVDKSPRDPRPSAARHGIILRALKVATAFKIGVHTLELIMDCLNAVVTTDERSLECGLSCITLCTKFHERTVISRSAVLEEAKRQQTNVTLSDEMEVFEKLGFNLTGVCSVQFSARVLEAAAEHTLPEQRDELMMLQAMLMVKAMFAVVGEKGKETMWWWSCRKSVHAVCSTLVAVALIVPNEEALQSARAFLPLVQLHQIDGCVEGYFDIALHLLNDTSPSADSRDVHFCNRILAGVCAFDHERVVDAVLCNGGWEETRVREVRNKLQ